jgi:hypothetical protein
VTKITIGCCIGVGCPGLSEAAFRFQPPEQLTSLLGGDQCTHSSILSRATAEDITTVGEGNITIVNCVINRLTKEKLLEDSDILYFHPRSDYPIAQEAEEGGRWLESAWHAAQHADPRGTA